jgi:hypothetical protein
MRGTFSAEVRFLSLELVFVALSSARAGKTWI